MQPQDRLGDHLHAVILPSDLVAVSLTGDPCAGQLVLLVTRQAADAAMGNDVIG